MKRLLLALTLILAVLVSGVAQDKLKIGEAKNGKLQVTNPDALKAFLANSLKNSGTLGKTYKVSASLEADRFFVYYPVSGNKDDVSCIGVMLVRQGNDAVIVGGQADSAPGPGGGGSATITCKGNPCAQCYPTISWPSGQWWPAVVCHCEEPDGTCNMEITITVNVEIGF